MYIKEKNELFLLKIIRSFIIKFSPIFAIIELSDSEIVLLLYLRFKKLSLFKLLSGFSSAKYPSSSINDKKNHFLQQNLFHYLI